MTRPASRAAGVLVVVAAVSILASGASAAPAPDALAPARSTITSEATPTDQLAASLAHDAPLPAPVSPVRASVRPVIAAVVGVAALGILLATRRRRPGATRRGAALSRFTRWPPWTWFTRLVPDAVDHDRVTIVSRSHLGPRESIGLVRVGNARFLVGITSGTISLLARLPDGDGPDAAARGDFSAALEHAVRAAAAPARRGGSPVGGEAVTARRTRADDARLDDPAAAAARLRDRLAAAMRSREPAITGDGHPRRVL